MWTLFRYWMLWLQYLSLSLWIFIHFNHHICRFEFEIKFETMPSSLLEFELAGKQQHWLRDLHHDHDGWNCRAKTIHPATISRRRSGASKINRCDDVLSFQCSIAVPECRVWFICVWTSCVLLSQAWSSSRQALHDDHYCHHQLDNSGRIFHANGRFWVKALLQRCCPPGGMQI